MIIRRIWPLANDHPEDPATCKWSSGGSDNLQMIIWRIRPLANDHPEDQASCKWSSGGTGLLQMIICHPRHPNHLSQDLNSILWTFLEQFAVVFLFLLCSFSPLRIEYSSFLLFLLLCCQQQKSEHHLEICIAYLVYSFPVSSFVQRVPHIFIHIKSNDPFYL